MFRNYCCALNPNDAVYCSACGRTINPSLESGKVEHKAENLATVIPEIAEALPGSKKARRDTSDILKGWVDELKKVHAVWSHN